MSFSCIQEFKLSLRVFFLFVRLSAKSFVSQVIFVICLFFCLRYFEQTDMKLNIACTHGIIYVVMENGCNSLKLYKRNVAVRQYHLIIKVYTKTFMI